MRQHKRNNPQLIIIGGGASGLAAACLCAEKGLAVTLLEKENRVGRKLLATGNGRCNLMHMGPPVFFGDQGFSNQVMASCGPDRVLAFWEGLGLTTREEPDGRLYPATGQAATVLDCLRLRLEASPRCDIVTGAQVTGIQKKPQGFLVTTGGGERFEAPFVLAAPGGAAAPKLGGGSSLMKPLAALGHQVISQRPALCPLVTDTKAIRGLSGLRMLMRLGLEVSGKTLSASAGEGLFTDYGLSGLCAMQLAREADEALTRSLPVRLVIDFSPGLGIAPIEMCRLSPQAFDEQAEQNRRALSSLLARREKQLGREMLYVGLLPRLLIEKVQGLPLPEAALWLTGLRLPISAVKGFDQAQVSSGGLDCADFDPATLASRRAPGLYVTGEALNVDGDCGGYNLLFAWATGILAATDILARAGL